MAYGDERLRTDEAYNLHLVNRAHCAGALDMPVMEPVDFVPTGFLPFNYAKTTTDKHQTLHFFIDDYQFERVWNKPEKYLHLLQGFEAVLTPDFSCYADMPLPEQRWNEYRRRALGNWWQRNGITVIPTLSWSDERSYSFCFGDLPRGATYAVSTVGCMKRKDAREAWSEGMNAAIETLHPKRLLIYGKVPDFGFGDIEVVAYPANAAFRR